MTLFGDFVTGQPVTFQRFSKLLFDQGGGIQEGVVNAGELKVSQRGAGANLSVDVAVGSGWVQVDTGTNNGLKHILSDAVANVGPVTTGHATLPRVDQVILRYNDTAIPTGSGNTPTLEILTGTATSGATIDNRTGAAALPNDCLRLADFLMPAAATSVTTANIRDRRTFSRGFRNVITPSDMSWGSGVLTLVTGSQIRAELSGAPIAATYKASTQNTNATADRAQWAFHLDAVQQPSLNGSSHFQTIPASAWAPVHLRVDLASLAAGTHLLDFRVARNAGANYTDTGISVVVEEIVRQNTSN